MRKLILSIAALAAFGLAVPYASSAKAEDTVVIHKHGDRDRDMHRHHHGVVVIKHSHDHDHDHM